MWLLLQTMASFREVSLIQSVLSTVYKSLCFLLLSFILSEFVFLLYSTYIQSSKVVRLNPLL